MTRAAVLFDVAPGIHLAADTFGDPDAPVVLLLHGGGQTRHAWHTTATNLADAGWHAITVDLRGHGESTHPRPPAYALEDFTADVRALTSSIAGDPIVIGASLGGIAALLALTESPAAPAAGLVLVDVAHRFQPRGGGRIVSFMGEHPDGFATRSTPPTRSPPIFLNVRALATRVVCATTSDATTTDAGSGTGTQRS